MSDASTGTSLVSTSGTKACSACGVEKVPEEFHRDQRRKDGRCNTCKACASARARAWFLANRARHADNNHRWYERNKEQVLQKTNLYSKQRRADDPKTYLVNAAKRRASKRGIPFDLTPADIEIPERCPVLGIPMLPSSSGSGRACDSSPSLDRIIPSLGYVRGNVEVISWRANRLKGDGTLDEVERIAHWLRGKSIPSA